MIERFCDLTTPLSRDTLRQPIEAHNMHERAVPLRDFNVESPRRLSPADVAAIDAITGDPMARVGYAPSALPG